MLRDPGTIIQDDFQRFYSVTNTILSLLGSTIATFVASAALENRFNMVHIQVEEK